MRKTLLGILACSMAITFGAVDKAHASLNVFQTFGGSVGYSADGFGSSSNAGTISASVPVGSTVLGAFLYQATYFTLDPSDATLNGFDVAFGPSAVHSGGFLATKRADVTGIVKPIIDVGAGGVYNFAIAEIAGGGFDNVNGEALVVVYTHPSLPVSTFAILDGDSAFAGDATAVNFANPLDPTTPGFFAEMALGISHSFPLQSSNVTVNGTLITGNAGSFDDGQGADGALLTMGGFDDPFSSLLPSYADDHERYNLFDYINNGDTSINITTVNPSADDNIFLALFHVFGEATVNEPNGVIPEPSSMLLLGAGLALAGLRKRKRAVKS